MTPDEERFRRKVLAVAETLRQLPPDKQRERLADLEQDAAEIQDPNVREVLQEVIKACTGLLAKTAPKRHRNQVRKLGCHTIACITYTRLMTYFIVLLRQMLFAVPFYREFSCHSCNEPRRG